MDNPDLLGKVADSIEQSPKDNTLLAFALVELGFHKQDGTALGTSPVSRIRKVVKNLSSHP